MPLYYKGLPRGYDLDVELPFIMIGGEKCAVGAHGSIIMICSICGEEHFRDHVSQYETCFSGHGQMHPFKFKDRERISALWVAGGEGRRRRITTLEERRARRKAEEIARPWNWVFGDKTEADFPLGYVKES